MPINANTFQEYDQLKAELAALDGVDSALNDARGHFDRDCKALARTEHKLSCARDRVAHHKKKIDACEHNWFSSTTALQPDTWFSGGVKERIKRQQQKLVAKQQEASQLSSKEKDQQQQRLSDAEAVSRLETAQRRRNEVDQKASAIYNGVVDAFLTPQLVALRQDRKNWHKLDSHKAADVQQMAKVVELCDTAVAAFTDALHTLGGAMRNNQNAQFANTMDIFTPGPSFGLEMYETMGQVQRDRLMRAAASKVGLGSQSLQQAMHSIPPTAHAAYPQECAGLCEVHLPHVELTGGGELMLEVFGGDFGDMIANSSAAGKIQRSLGSIHECLHIAIIQAKRVLRLHDILAQDHARATAALQQTDAQIGREMDRIWCHARSSVGVPTAVPVNESKRVDAAAPLPVAVPVNSGTPTAVVAGVPVAIATAAPVMSEY